MFWGFLRLAPLASLSFFPLLVRSLSVNGNILVIAQNAYALKWASASLRSYGIPYTTALISSSATALPQLTASETTGNFGGIIVAGTPLSSSQLQQLYTYQTALGVRMVRYDVEPATEFGTKYASGDGCCNTGVEQLVSATNTTFFPTAGLKRGTGITTLDLWHTPATITNTSIATEIAQFGVGGPFKTVTTAAVVNKIGNREQMVWFMPFELEWSITSNLLMHTWVHYLTRGLYTGFRRVNFNTQIDDVFLGTGLYSPSGTTFRLRGSDLEAHKSWTTTIKGKMSIGSNYFMELAHNGNGNVQNGSLTSASTCSPGSISYTPNPETPVEFEKPLGTGTDVWPTSPANFVWSTQCLALDTLEAWMTKTENLNAFSHMSHTFTHLSLNNATYSDVNKEISFNKDWLTASGIASATRFSGKGLVPPAITGLHNGDALRAWANNGITSATGDNTRPTLANTENEHWPHITNVEDSGFAGFTVIPRWATNIYYNCDKPACITTQYRDTYSVDKTFATIMAEEKTTNVKHLLALRRDPFMFHQANLRQVDMDPIPVNGVSAKYSLVQQWVETIVQEYVRLVSWPLITLKHDDLAAAFVDRRNRDLCRPSLVYNFNTANTAIESVTISATDVNCATRIPLTLPGDVVSRGTATAEWVGSDPLTLWVALTGQSQTFALKSAIGVVRG